MGSFVKRFVHRHLNVFNFFTASIIICICLIVLMPAVHLPLSTTNGDEPHPNEHDDNGNHNHNHHHHHHHRIPMGEVLICAGFFVFHSIGLLVSGRKMDEREPLLIAERKLSTVCCSSTRCPSSREIPEPNPRSSSALANNSYEQMLDGAHMVYSAGQDDDCVLLLNQHHQHHTHNTHHEHVIPSSSQNQSATRARASSSHYYNHQSNYGSMAPDLVRNLLAHETGMTDLEARGGKHSRVYVEEIKACSMPDDENAALTWPLSIKVFRAAAVGALLYIAFFLVLPKNPAGCGSCSKETA